MAFASDSVFFDFLLFVTTFLVGLLVYYKRSFSYWTKRNVPTFNPSFPFGNLQDVIFKRCSFAQVFDKAYKKLKRQGIKYVGFYFFTKPVFVVFDTELARSVLIKDFSHFYDRSFYIDKKKDPLSAHVFAMKGAEWKKMRDKLSPTFTNSKLKMMFETLKNCSDGLTPLMQEAMNNGTTIEIGDVAARFTTDSIASCAFGIESNTLEEPHSEFRKHGERFIGREGGLDLIKLVMGTFCPEILVALNINLFSKEMQSFFLKLVQETIKYREVNNVIRRDFMHLMIQLKNNIKIVDDENLGTLINNEKHASTNSDSITVEDIASQVILFYLAGFETSSSAIAFCMLELALNQGIQDKVRQEIITTLDEHDGKITYASLSKMTYLESCIQETLRKYPTLPNLFRECTKTYKVSGTDVVIERGTFVYIPLFNIQRDEEHFKNPDVFDPDRFMVGNSDKLLPCTWMPFGEGPRICIGLRFGMMQVKLAIVAMLKDFRYNLNSKTKLPVIINPQCFTMSVLGGVWLDPVKL